MDTEEELVTIRMYANGAWSVRIAPSIHERQPELLRTAAETLSKAADTAAADQEPTVCLTCGATVEGVYASPDGELAATPCGHRL